MRNMRKPISLNKVWLALTVAAVLAVPSTGCDASSRFPRSPDGRYELVEVRGEAGGIHYQAKTVQDGKVILTTHGEYSTPNDVKAGTFSADSTKVAAAYHYGHAGNYTWIGVWDLRTRKFVRSVRLEGWTTSIPDSVFENGKD
jgi:hypothetical protein